MRTFYAGPFSRYALHVSLTETTVWDAERPDAKGKATQVYSASNKADALTWVAAQIAAQEVAA